MKLLSNGYLVARAGSNSAQLSGGDGRIHMDPLRVVHRVERKHFSAGVGHVWLPSPTDHGRAEFANQEAERLRAQGFTVRVRPVVL